MRVLAGTSGYSYPQWKGSFYPEDLPASKMLAHYAGRLPTVEINNTFYRMPKPEVVRAWAEAAPEGFSFVLKSPRQITHVKRLAADSADSVRRFFEVGAELGAKRGPALFQLPPFLKQDVARLAAFLDLLPADVRAAFEFRHESWFDDEVYAALRARGAALCIAEDEDLATPLVPTADWGYLRLRRQDYDGAAVRVWAERLRAQPWQDAWVFFKHEDEGVGPRLAAELLAEVAKTG